MSTRWELIGWHAWRYLSGFANTNGAVADAAAGTMVRWGSMNSQRRDLLLVMTLAGAASRHRANGCALGRPADSGKQSAAAIPDFSGIWAHPFLTGFEPPASGPGPARNRSRLPPGPAIFRSWWAITPIRSCNPGRLRWSGSTARFRSPARVIQRRAISVGRAACPTSFGISCFKCSSGRTTS
jgi:hypothetical protein